MSTSRRSRGVVQIEKQFQKFDEVSRNAISYKFFATPCDFLIHML